MEQQTVPKTHRTKKMPITWTADNVSRLFLVTLAVHHVHMDYKQIARAFGGEASPRAIEEKMKKLRKEQRDVSGGISFNQRRTRTPNPNPSSNSTGGIKKRGRPRKHAPKGFAEDDSEGGEDRKPFGNFGDLMRGYLDRKEKIKEEMGGGPGTTTNNGLIQPKLENIPVGFLAQFPEQQQYIQQRLAQQQQQKQQRQLNQQEFPIKIEDGTGVVERPIKMEDQEQPPANIENLPEKDIQPKTEEHEEEIRRKLLEEVVFGVGKVPGIVKAECFDDIPPILLPADRTSAMPPMRESPMLAVQEVLKAAPPIIAKENHEKINSNADNNSSIFYHKYDDDITMVDAESKTVEPNSSVSVDNSPPEAPKSKPVVQPITVDITDTGDALGIAPSDSTTNAVVLWTKPAHIKKETPEKMLSGNDNQNNGGVIEIIEI